MKGLNIFFGIALALGIPFVGILISSFLEHIAALGISIITTPFLALYFFNTPKYKTIGIGMCIGLIPIAFAIFIFYLVTKLH